HNDFVMAAKKRIREMQLCQELRAVEHEWGASHEENRPAVGDQQIAQVVSMWTGIPVVQIDAEEAGRLLKLEDELHQRVIGQHAAVQTVARAVRRSRTNLRDGRRPIGSFIFVGPTGVGKTELARALATTLFGDENALIKLDMSEFMESHHVSRLIGAPPGYVGHDQAGQLTEAIHRRPYIVVFHTLEHEHLREILDLMIAQTQKRMKDQAIELQVTDAARCLLVKHGYDPFYGARPLRRTVQRMLEDLLAESILQGAFAPGDTIVVDAADGKLAVNTLLVDQDSL